MTRPKSECKACGRVEGHYLNCKNSPRPNEIIVPAFEELPQDSVCREPGCDDPVKNSRSLYCAEHGTRSAHAARTYLARKALEKEKTDAGHG